LYTYQKIFKRLLCNNKQINVSNKNDENDESRKQRIKSLTNCRKYLKKIFLNNFLNNFQDYERKEEKVSIFLQFHYNSTVFILTCVDSKMQ